jgi:tetratricopeptide (TPR) repeat protein
MPDMFPCVVIFKAIIILVILSMAGAFGGYLAAIHRNITCSTNHKTPFKMINMLQGVAGAIIIVTLSPVDPHILSAPFAVADLSEFGANRGKPTVQADTQEIKTAEQYELQERRKRESEDRAANIEELFIKLIALALIGGYAGGSLLETSAKQYAKKFEEIGQKQQELGEKQEEIDQKQERMEDEQRRSLEAIRETEKILRGLEPSSEELWRFETLVREGSSFTRFDIANRADEVRRQHWKNDRIQLKWASLIFRSLLKTDDAKSNHWWYASLGYCLKDQPRPDYSEALQCFNDAINLRGSEARSGAYEFNRAYCYIKLEDLDDPKFSRQIEKDLDAASKYSRFRDITEACLDVKKWREAIKARGDIKNAA